MLDQDGTICFASELMETVDAFLSDYEAVRGHLDNELQRCLTVLYALGVMRRNIDAIWDRLAEEAVFGPLEPRKVFEECVGECELETASLRMAVGEDLRRRGWLSDSSSP
ncbi:MAG TPA: hypothetical protein VMX14_01535 [Anaerolineae bacterium]|nr:hypothetical protein [Anaerolineae bacterium]